MTSKELGDKGNLISSALSIPVPPSWGSGVGRRQACTGQSLLISTGFPNAWTVQFIASSRGAICVTAICEETSAVGRRLGEATGHAPAAAPIAFAGYSPNGSFIQVSALS
jgi:hypothetical protein